MGRAYALPPLNPHSLLFLLILLHLCPIAFAIGKSDCSILLGSSIYAAVNNQNPPWVSPSGEFAFGFRQIEPLNGENPFLLAIWFNKIPEQTIVWSRNGNPVAKGSRVTLTKDGKLILYDPGNKEIWKAPTNNSQSSCAAMLDSGNFVLKDKDSNLVWESFKEPTDTILPGQILGMDSKLRSRQSETNYTDGRFWLRMQSDGNLVLYPVSVPTDYQLNPYWASGTVNPGKKTELIYSEGGYIYVEQGAQSVFNITRKQMGSKQDFYHMARIDPDGAFRQYNHPRREYTASVNSCSSSWSVVEQIPGDVCRAITSETGSGICGFNSYCKDENGKTSCKCPERYSYVDPFYEEKGCKPDFPLPSCRQDGWETKLDLVEFKELNSTDWPLTDYELQRGAQVDKEMCKELCRRDCFCAVAIYNGDSCWKKRFPLSNGRYAVQENRTALIKVPRENAETGQCQKTKDASTLILVGSLLLGSSVFLNFLLLLAISVAVFLSYQKKLQDLKSSSNALGMNVRLYAYKELEEATGGFKQTLGRGAFGTVYKGVLASDPKRFIAVKRLHKVEEEGEKEFKTEVSVIGQTHHKNLVRLLGYCVEGEHRLLVYEYMTNGSLASLLFGISRPDWNKRLQIACGIARGLMYLHEECSTQIIHCDIKPQNILLDECFTPRISDFGLAKLLLAEQTRAARTGIRGTVGYFAPEWFRKASINTKVDVYSFGAVLLEIICCKSSVQFGLEEEEQSLMDWTYECYCQRKVDKLVESDEEAKNDMKRVERLVMVAIWCIQEDPSLRPSMRKVTQMLEGVIEVTIPPRPFSYTVLSHNLT